MAMVSPSLPLRVCGSVDTKQRIPYNPHRTYPKKTQTPASLLTTSPNLNIPHLIKRNTLSNTTPEVETSYMGYETWLPSPPKVEKPRSVFNAATLAYIGDCIFELYARRHFLFPPLKIDEYNDRVMAVVRCETQDAMLRKLIEEHSLSEEERKVLRWGKNLGSAKTKTRKRAGVAVYNRASSLETLIGYLYLTNKQRLDEIMLMLGFSVGDSNQLMLEELQNLQMT
ncbi:hypothetical protein Leryth_001902 [Lithospermum erythrorhizon]|uniref:RNase III domain-containing protein n=1 Tax=Lithospermum erythrorhizon TaxID=34254 RepID=A0AAV3NTR5_LITER|nr:hypothetical protein Leryth_001902 [Lithospermum erythrorhizon]